MAKTHVLIVGGGAAGIMAAIAARRNGANVTILERNLRIGKKILATGNGRCNYTNINADVSNYHGNNPKFAYAALSSFSPLDTINFFEELGVVHKIEELGKVFPMSNQASSILDVLLYELNNIGVKILCDTLVKNIKPSNDKFVVELVDKSKIQGDRVIIATGGKAMPSTGSDGNGFELARRLGHTITDIFPGLVQLKLEGTFFKQIQGVKFIGTAELLRENKILAKDRGDILFANYGVSGPPILQISRKAAEMLNNGQEAILKIIIIDSMEKEKIKHLLVTRIKSRPHKPLDFSLVGLVNKRLIPVLLKEAGFTVIKIPVASLTNKDLDRIVHILTDWRFKIRGTKSWPSAQVTAGGIATQEINPSTMESKLIKGLYFAGEIIDIDGECGGFNLQWAWSSGYLAGQHAASWQS